MDGSNIALIGGSANPELARKIAGHLGLQLSNVRVERFRDGKPNVQILDDVRDLDVYIIQSDGPSAIEETTLYDLINAARRSANRVTVVMPYFSSGRGDQRDEPGKPIPAAEAASRLVETRTNRFVLLHLHAGQIVGMFEAAGARHVDHLYFRSVALDQMAGIDLSNTIVSPTDLGGAKGARSFWSRLRKMGFPVEFGIVFKFGSSAAGIEEMHAFGDFKGKDAWLIDDQISSGRTIFEATNEVFDQGARSASFLATHWVLPYDRPERLAVCHQLMQSRLSRIWVSDSLMIPAEELAIMAPKLTVISVAPLLAMVIQRLHVRHRGHRLSNLFELDGYREGLKELLPTS